MQLEIRCSNIKPSGCKSQSIDAKDLGLFGIQEKVIELLFKKNTGENLLYIEENNNHRNSDYLRKWENTCKCTRYIITIILEIQYTSGHILRQLSDPKSGCLLPKTGNTEYV